MSIYTNPALKHAWQHKKAASPLPEGSGSGIWGGAPFSDGNCFRNFLANKKIS